MNSNFLRRWRIAFLSLLLSTFAAGCTVLPPARHAVTPYGSFSFSTAGDGLPAVVFESGLGDGREAWQRVFADVGKFTTVFAYDRSGYGDSRATVEDRSAREIVEELRALLKAAHVEPP